jgi:hypothetical protein
MPLAHTQRPSAPDSHTTDTTLNQQYDTLMAHFTAGEHGRVELGAGEDRVAVREMLQAAAQRRNLQLTFRRGRGPLTFRVEALQKAAKRAAQRSEAPAMPAEVGAPAPAVAAPAQESAPEQPVSAPHKPVRPRKAAPVAAQRRAPQQTAEPSKAPAGAPAQQTAEPSKAPAGAPAQQAAPAPETNRPRPQQRAQRAPEQRGTRGPDQRGTRAADQRASSTNRRDNADNRRKSDDRRASSSRYDDMLPRWMREGERPAGQNGRSRGDGKRRTRS